MNTNFLEKDLELFIWDNYNNLPDILQQNGLPIKGKMFRQVNLGEYGRCDLITIDCLYDPNVLKVYVYELKKDQINSDTLLQAIGYCIGMEALIDTNQNRHKITAIDFNIILIGNSIDLNSNFTFIPKVFNNVSFYTYTETASGLIFSIHNDFSIMPIKQKLHKSRIRGRKLKRKYFHRAVKSNFSNHPFKD